MNDFQVHMWPIDGSLIVINADVAYSIPAVTHITVGLPEDTTQTMRDAVIVLARVLAIAGRPPGVIIEHRPDGSMLEIDPESFEKIMTLRAASIGGAA